MDRRDDGVRGPPTLRSRVAQALGRAALTGEPQSFPRAWLLYKFAQAYGRFTWELEDDDIPVDDLIRDLEFFRMESSLTIERSQR